MIGNINYINGLFLGKEELARQQLFIKNNLISLIRVSGNRGLYLLRNKYTASLDNNILTLNGHKDILGIDNESNIIYFDRPKSIFVGDSIGTPLYISISANTTNNEEGTVSLSSTGVLTGTGTKFLEVLRGSYTKKGSKVYFPEIDKTYLVESVTSNTIAKLIGPISEEISNTNWAVVGTFSPFSLANLTNQFPYQYYSYQLGVSTQLPNESSSFVIGKISWNGNTPQFEFVQNNSFILKQNGGDSGFDYIVDSDESLRLLRSNSQATNVLIKKGTYTYNSLDGRGIILHPNTRLIWAEGGSLIKIFSSPTPVSNSFAFGYNNPPQELCSCYNLNIENNRFGIGLSNMRNLVNCNIRYTFTTLSYGYANCNRLVNCLANSVNSVGAGMFNCVNVENSHIRGFATGFTNCNQVSRCYAECTSGYSNSYASRRVDLTFTCADTANGGFNASLGEVPPPPITNYNRIYLGVDSDSSSATLRVTSEFPVASNITFEVVVINSLGKEEQSNINLAIGESLKTKPLVEIIDPNQLYSISNVSASVSQDSTYTYEINF